MRDTVAQPSKWNLLCPKSYQLFWKLACSWFKFAQEIYFIETEVVGCFCLDKVIRATYRLKFSGLKNWQSLNIFQPLIQNGSCSTHILHTPWLHDTLKSWINYLTGRVCERISCGESAIFFQIVQISPILCTYWCIKLSHCFCHVFKLKLRHHEMATKFEKSLPPVLTNQLFLLHSVKPTGRLFQFFLSFSEKLDFKKKYTSLVE